MAWWNVGTSTAADPPLEVFGNLPETSSSSNATPPVTRVNEHPEVVATKSVTAAAVAEDVAATAEFVARSRVADPPSYVAEQHVPQADAITYLEAQAALPEARRRMLLAQAKLLAAQRAERAAVEKAQREVREVYAAEYRQALRALDATFDEVLARNELARAIWARAQEAGAPLPECFSPHFIADESRSTSWVLHWRRILREEGWLP